MRGRGKLFPQPVIQSCSDHDENSSRPKKMARTRTPRARRISKVELQLELTAQAEAGMVQEQGVPVTARRCATAWPPWLRQCGADDSVGRPNSGTLLLRLNHARRQPPSLL